VNCSDPDIRNISYSELREVEIPGSKKDYLQMIGFADVGFLGRYSGIYGDGCEINQHDI
jgi:hypothetical protein